MSHTSDLLTILMSYHEGYRLMRRRVHSHSISERKFFRETSDGHARVILSRLKKRGLVERRRNFWFITKRGEAHLAKQSLLRKLIPKSAPRKPKSMIVAFDIPERNKRGRNWLRMVLRNMGFEMLQKSVWFGPAPLPQDFISGLKEARLLPFMKFFKAEEADIV